MSGAFGDATVAATRLDRLLHQATTVGIDGPSYRLHSHRNQAEALRAGVNARVSSRTRLRASSASMSLR
ncbi:ATP-binding protein [Streptomyces sp. NPDC091371]|uniref:ATP-binding protein n=1 Tax=Streptomyces sp. NPDC091371 TaxID=3155303 RepID=UPI00341A80D9